jgi:class 3 adenylate cyclase
MRDDVSFFGIPDIVGSTELAAKMANHRWHDIVQSYYVAIRAKLVRFSGTEIDTAGGLFASFDGPARVIRCGRAICEVGHQLGINIRVGVHIGECVQK